MDEKRKRTWPQFGLAALLICITVTSIAFAVAPGWWIHALLGFGIIAIPLISLAGIAWHFRSPWLGIIGIVLEFGWLWFLLSLFQ